MDIQRVFSGRYYFKLQMMMHNITGFKQANFRVSFQDRLAENYLKID